MLLCQETLADEQNNYCDEKTHTVLAIWAAYLPSSKLGVILNSCMHSVYVYSREIKYSFATNNPLCLQYSIIAAAMPVSVCLSCNGRPYSSATRYGAWRTEVRTQATPGQIDPQAAAISRRR